MFSLRAVRPATKKTTRSALENSGWGVAVEGKAAQSFQG